MGRRVLLELRVCFWKKADKSSSLSHALSSFHFRSAYSENNLCFGRANSTLILFWSRTPNFKCCFAHLHSEEYQAAKASMETWFCPHLPSGYLDAAAKKDKSALTHSRQGTKMCNWAIKWQSDIAPSAVSWPSETSFSLKRNECKSSAVRGRLTQQRGDAHTEVSLQRCKVFWGWFNLLKIRR